jgi:hypothetical protein
VRSNQEINEYCAEALGWVEEVIGSNPIHGTTLSVWHKPACPTKSKRPIPCKCVTGDPPDFLHSEDANAMLLEAMPPMTELVKAQFWQVWNLNIDKDKALGVDTDRRTAIVNAFVAFIEAGGKVNGK